jgi:hypothetical protein
VALPCALFHSVPALPFFCNALIFSCAAAFVISMLVLHPSSRCDVCLDDYTWVSPTNSPHAISCGHIFCLTCAISFMQATCSSESQFCFVGVYAHYTRVPAPSVGKISNQTESRSCMSTKHQTSRTELMYSSTHIRLFYYNGSHWSQERMRLTRMSWRS